MRWKNVHASPNTHSLICVSPSFSSDKALNKKTPNRADDKQKKKSIFKQQMKKKKREKPHKNKHLTA